MSLEAYRSTLAQITGKTLADGAFVFADPADSDAAPADGVAIDIRFEGPVTGFLCLEAPVTLGAEIAANLLESDHAPTDQESIEAMKELVNMIAGSFLPAAFGVQAEFRLGLPSEPHPIGVQPPPGSSISTVLTTDEGHCFRVWVYGSDA